MGGTDSEDVVKFSEERLASGGELDTDADGELSFISEGIEWGMRDAREESAEADGALCLCLLRVKAEGEEAKTSGCRSCFSRGESTGSSDDDITAVRDEVDCRPGRKF